MKKKILITGAAGFIGYHLAKAMAERGDRLIGIDNLNDYYDVSLKKARLAQLEHYGNFTFRKIDMADRKVMADLFHEGKFEFVVNLAAQTGVRYSLKNPYSYIDSNIVGFTNILEGCRHNHIQHLVFASSSSIYGMNTKIPFSVSHNVDHPVSLYAASKKANELMAHTYAHLYGLPCTGIRFFTVYGPWGRPDMAYFSFTKSILEGLPIDVYNFGNMKRDFTYIDDIVDGVIRVMERIPQPTSGWDMANPNPGSSYAPYKLYNIGNNNPVELTKFIEILEAELGRKAEKNLLPMQAGDVPVTYADIDDLVRDVGFRPVTTIEEGIEKFVAWYRSYYKVT
ncbi:MAG: capsular biosynthesis protein CpsI [Deltaproteobacteria bacterium RBG_16_44_11]|nr:MAG: capsular biosynthesis protein CpsI [Deltaproteobacteria bacterium RBG_16_44_11]